jgi:signal transduction histidine kinase
MSRILLLLDHAENRRLLAEWLAEHYEIVSAPAGQPFEADFDLCILDGQALARYGSLLERRKVAEPAVFLPVLLVASRPYAAAVTKHLGKTIEEVVFTPIEMMELLARVESLLRTRNLSLELNLRREDLEAFIQGMAHDLRAPLQSISGFAETLAEEQGPRMDERGRHQLERLQAATEHMWGLIAALVEFSRVGRKAIKLDEVDLKAMVENCLLSVGEVIRETGAQFDLSDCGGMVLADRGLLRIALSNLISNAMKYVAPGVQPCVRIASTPRTGRLRILVQDNGIGIAEADQERIFAPFVRLHGVEEYAGLGLGLSTVRKVVDMMGGQMGVESAPLAGATFWIDLAGAEAQ